MKQKKTWLGAALGLALCVLALAATVLLQHVGYIGMLDSDIASEVILGKRQADTGSLIQMDWLYSTEVRILGPNLLYALAFVFGASFKWARIIGNTLGLALVMASCVFALRKAKVSWTACLFAAAMLPMPLSVVYGYVMAMGGFYLSHCMFGFMALGMWLAASGCSGSKRRLAALTGVYMLTCALLGAMSVRYVLCFVCPMVVVAGLDVLLAPQMSASLRDRHMRFGGVTAAGFAACLLGYGASEILYPRLFTSGTGSASSFMFGALDGKVIADTVFTVFADFLKLLGWRGGVPLFSIAGIINVCIAGVLVLGAIMLVRVYRALDEKESAQRRQKRMIRYAFAAFFVNLFCFMFVEGTYLNRYLILAVLFFVPVTAIAVCRERNMRLRLLFVVVLCLHLGLGGTYMLMETRRQAPGAEARSADMMDIADQLIGQGYTHGYGSFWNVRVMQERTQGALTFTGVVPEETEEGAVCPVSLHMIRWLEPDGASHMDAIGGKTFLVLTGAEKTQMAAWLAWAQAPVVCENGTYTAYGFDSAQALINAMLFGKMKLENASAAPDGGYVMAPGGRMRVPTDYREAGNYRLRFTAEGEGGEVKIYTGRNFTQLASQAITPGENALSFSLDADDKYFMILFTNEGEGEIRIAAPELERE